MMKLEKYQQDKLVVVLPNVCYAYFKDIYRLIAIVFVGGADNIKEDYTLFLKNQKKKS